MDGVGRQDQADEDAVRLGFGRGRARHGGDGDVCVYAVIVVSWVMLMWVVLLG